MNGDAIGALITIGIFGAVGLMLARRLPSRVPLHTTVLLAIVVIVGAFVGVNTRLVSVFGVAIRANWAIASCCLAILVSALLRSRRSGGAPRRAD